MVTRMDRSVGRILDQLKELKLDENTLVIFTSDNGPTHNVGGADSTFFSRPATLRGLKGSLYEGGIRTPFIACWPGDGAAGQRRATCRSAFWDVLPTLAELAGAEAPKGIDGISFVPTLTGQGRAEAARLPVLGVPGYGGQQAVIAGDWKAVRQNLAKKVVKTELYDLKADPNETTDVAAKHPDVVKRLEEADERSSTRRRRTSRCRGSMGRGNSLPKCRGCRRRCRLLRPYPLSAGQGRKAGCLLLAALGCE